jgi:hypothetical protein
MGFNFGAFVGGASDNLVNMIKTKEAELYEEQKDEKERLREARVEATRKRQADEEEAKGLIESLSLFYTPDQVKDIMANGKAPAKYAINHGEYMAGRGLSASASYSMPKTSVQSEFTFDINDPRGSQVSPQMAAMEKEQVDKAIREAPVDSTQPFISRFTQPPKEDDMTKAKTFEARLVELDFQRTNATSQQKRDEFDQAYNNTLDSYQKFKEDLDGKGTDTSGLDFSKQSRDSHVDNEIQRTFELEGYAEKDISGKIKLVQTGNMANSFALRYRAHGNLVSQYGDSTDKAFTTMINNVKNGTDQSVNVYRQNVYRAHLGVQRAAADNNTTIEAQDTATANKFKPLPSEGRTKEEVMSQAAKGMYGQNDVVQYTDENGTLKMALVSDYGVLF